MHVDKAEKVYVTQANFPKVRFTYIKSTRNFREQCPPNCILREFAAIKT